ncbi:MAG: hypothetical protein LUQ31_09210 [Methanoregula sp.]|nr:hypothetical protein [Methanoregula sp.]
MKRSAAHPVIKKKVTVVTRPDANRNWVIMTIDILAGDKRMSGQYSSIALDPSGPSLLPRISMIPTMR